MKTRNQQPEQPPENIAKRRDDAIRRALNTPPKPYKDAKVGKAKPKPSAPSGKR